MHIPANYYEISILMSPVSEAAARPGGWMGGAGGLGYKGGLDRLPI